MAKLAPHEAVGDPHTVAGEWGWSGHDLRHRRAQFIVDHLVGVDRQDEFPAGFAE
jgi:hypothetical protein